MIADCFNNNNSDFYMEKYKEYNDCVFQHQKKECDNCEKEYMDLNFFYISLDQHNNGEVCFDLQDLVSIR